MFGCDCYPRQYLHEFVNFPPPDCQTTQHAAETVSLRLRTTLGVFRGHVVISSPALCFQRFLCDIVVFLAYISKSGRIS